MLLVAGIDPGLTGAIAIYNRDADMLVSIGDIPTVKVKIGAASRNRLDVPKLRAHLAMLRDMFDVQLICVEKVQGYGGKDQSASAAFQFGEVFGRIMTLAEEIAPVEAPAPAVWKLREKIPLDAEAIVKKAEAEFPYLAALFRGPKKGPLHDRAEAAFLARYAARRIWPILVQSMAERAAIHTSTVDGGTHAWDYTIEKADGSAIIGTHTASNAIKGPNDSITVDTHNVSITRPTRMAKPKRAARKAK